MTPADDGRFCAHCERVVVDLTAGPPSAAAATMARAHRGDPICVRRVVPTKAPAPTTLETAIPLRAPDRTDPNANG